MPKKSEPYLEFNFLLILKTTFTIDGDKLIQTQKDPKTGQVVCVITREVLSNNELKATIVAGKVEAIRTYSRL